MTETQDQEAVIAFLSRPENLGAAASVRRIDTHGAIVFLAGEHAWKLKRAVRYGYLDFSTAERRKTACEAELALNRRTAPELYLEVCGINRQKDGGLGFGPGVPVDWVVVMRRFDAADLLENVARRCELTPQIARELADHIASFHDRAEVVDGGGGAARMRAVIDGNRESMAAAASFALPPEYCAELHERSLAMLKQLAPLLDRRAATGHVRHCHGDLHLANICLWKGRPTLFDCLEFDPELARIDVLHDLAFLLMDLWHKGLRTQASLVFNRYLDMRDESGGMAAFPLFLSARAAVRAHVSATVALRHEDERHREIMWEETRAYRWAALSFLNVPPPRLIAIGGLSGTGKSTLAAALAPHIGAAPGARWLRTDVLRKRLAGAVPEEKLPPEAYTRERNAETYARLMSDAAAALAAGRAVIVDGVFADPQERAGIAGVAAAAGAPFAGLWLEAPRDMLGARVVRRRADASDADAAVIDRQMIYEVGEIAPWHRLDAGGTPDAVRRLALAAIGEGE